MRGATLLGGMIGALLVGGAGCGPAPYTIGPEEPASGESRTADCAWAPPAKVAVANAPAPAPNHSAAAEDRWYPDGLPRFNPFVDRRTWVGEYDCPQGRTGLTLRVVDVRGQKVRAIFDFHHAPTDASGQFLMAGTFDEETGDVQFAPGPWIIHPTDYEAVGMVGRVSVDGRHFMGRISSPGCGAFRLRSAQ
jgi:hypothetical protein